MKEKCLFPDFLGPKPGYSQVSGSLTYFIFVSLKLSYPTWLWLLLSLHARPSIHITFHHPTEFLSNHTWALWGERKWSSACG